MPVPNHILLIEDDDIDAEVVERALQKVCRNCGNDRCETCEDCGDVEPYVLDRCTHLSEGLSRLAEGRHALALLDLGLPDVPNNDPLEHIRVLHARIPVVVLTGQKDKSIALESLRKGAQDFLVKGEFTPRELHRCIMYAMERHRLKRELEKTAAELAHKSAILQSVISHMGDGVIVTDPEGRLTLFNPAALHLLDVKESTPSPQNSRQYDAWTDPSLLDQAKKKARPLLEVLSKDTLEDQELFLQTERSPEGRYVSITARSILDDRSGVKGCVAVLHDITQRRRSEQLKDEFVSLVSHELRTPLTSINGSLGLVLGGVAGELPQEARDMIFVAQRNSNRLVRLINDLLDIQKLEAGKMELKLVPIDMDCLIQRSLEANEGYAAKHQVSFEFVNGVEETLCVKGDEDKLLQVMANLLSNAVKYSPESGRVRVELTTTSDRRIQVRVTDQGPGIPEEFRDRIFSKFSQADSSTTRNKEGTGLGLSICRAIIALHNGTIDFDSTFGEGASFYFILPQDAP